jgi:hypothetical protein
MEIPFSPSFWEEFLPSLLDHLKHTHTRKKIPLPPPLLADTLQFHAAVELNAPG